MPTAIIVDDGGSTRIMHVPCAGNKIPAPMDNLLQVKQVKGGLHQSTDSAEGAFTRLLIVSIDAYGMLKTFPEAGEALQVKAGDSFEVHSGNNQQVLVTVKD